MSNRFVQGIRSGKIDSVEDLKTAFKELAKATHPDIAGPGSGAAFVAVRAEYEAALLNFERHRFGATLRSRNGVGAKVNSAELWACLALLLKRGFPKVPRHEKEILRYEYARWRFRGALRDLDSAEPIVGAFDEFEASLLQLKTAEPLMAESILSYLHELVDYASRALPPMRTALVRSFDELRKDAHPAKLPADFLFLLSSELGIGPTLA